MKTTPINETQTEQNSQPVQRGGAPRFNRNRERHGLFAGKLPAGCRYIENSINAFRRQLETEIIECHGSIGIVSAALVQSACRHEIRAKLNQRWLRETENEISKTVSKDSTNGSGTQSTATATRTTLGILEKSQLLREISNASDSRDKCLEKLNLSQPNDTPWLPSLPQFQTAENASKTTATPPDNESKDATTEATGGDVASLRGGLGK